jgi:hypothetical protein
MNGHELMALIFIPIGIWYTFHYFLVGYPNSKKKLREEPNLSEKSNMEVWIAIDFFRMLSIASCTVIFIWLLKTGKLK